MYNASTVYPASGQKESAGGYVDYPPASVKPRIQFGGRTESTV